MLSNRGHLVAGDWWRQGGVGPVSHPCQGNAVTRFRVEKG